MGDKAVGGVAELLGKLFDIGELPAKVVALVWLSTGAVLFAPESIGALIHTQRLAEDDYGTWFGLAFVASTVLLLLDVLLWASSACRVAVLKRRWRRSISQAIAALDPSEKAVLREFILQDHQTLLMPVDEPTVSGLCHRRMLEPAGKIGHLSRSGTLIPLRIEATLRKAITPQDLGLPAVEAELTEELRARILLERPIFVKMEAASIHGWLP